MVTLTICVATHCVGCNEARRLAGLARMRYPDLRIELIDLDADPAARPASVFAVPSYLLDGRLLYLGNPHPEGLFAQLDALALHQRGSNR